MEARVELERLRKTFARETLEVRSKGKHIAEVLAITVGV
jgi:excinuclease UvrABC ATPase subunit